MIIEPQQRLEFENVFPDEKQKNILDYLIQVSPFSLLNIIGFLTTNHNLNFDNFCSDLELRKDITNRVINYSKENDITKKPTLISRETSLRLAEIILSNREILLENNENPDSDKNADEINLLKSFLIINKTVNSKDKLISSENEINESSNNIEKMIDILISIFFPYSEIGIYENNDHEFRKLLYSTIVRFELLLDFIQSKDEFKYLEKSLYEYFNMESLDELMLQVKYLFAKLLQMKSQNGYKFLVDDKKALLFINSLVSKNISVDADYTDLKNHPLYRIEKNTFSIIDQFFVFDKFYKSVRFILKESFQLHHNLPASDRTFFSFFNTEFSEGFLMKELLDDIFQKKYFIKKEVKDTNIGEPDYYIRHNNRIFLFENKDILIAKETKNNGNIDEINKTLKKKLYKPYGINQLVNSIVKIVNNEFLYDDSVNEKNNLTIYPILLVGDRIFEILGINYRLNQWYLELLKEKLGDKYNSNFIKDLTIIDIDTVIYWLPYLKSNDHNLRKIIEKHLSEMRKDKKISTVDSTEVMEIINKNIATKLSPISNRLINYDFPIELFTKKFESITK